MLNQFFIYVYLSVSVFLVISFISLNISLKKMSEIQGLIVRDHQYQIDKLDLRIKFIESGQQFRMECREPENCGTSPDKEVPIIAKKRPGRPKKIDNIL